MTMKHLFSELDVAGVRLANRIVLPPMATEQADAEGHPSPATAGYYGSLAATGVALVVVEHSYVAPEGRASPRQMSLASEEMSNSDIVAAIRAFGVAAARVQGAGYDFVEVHCAHGYLLGQFLSPLTNHRTDAYGGTPAARRRLLLGVVEEVRAAVHGDLPLMVRLGVADNPPTLQLYEGGLTIAEGVEAARALDDAGVAILDLSAGICGSRPAGLKGEAYYRPFAEAVSAAVRCHVVCTGGITQPQTAEVIIQSGAADLIGVARAIAADHDWVRKAREATSH